MTGPYPEPPPQGDPPPPYAGPPPGYGAPPPAYGAPPPGYGAPPPAYGAPPPYAGPPPPAASGGRRMIIVLVSIVGVLALACVAGIAGVVWYVTHKDSAGDPSASNDISGVVDYRTTHPDWLAREHREQGEVIEYPMKPAAGGPHHPVWQQCNGDVYQSPVDEGNAVHSLEHGAVWITYQRGVPAAEVEKLAARVRGHDFMLLSPYEGQSTRVSLQAWGYQLQVSSVDDERIDAFIRKYRQTATLEPGVVCSTGTTATQPS